jgi:NTP pyrophosphatase (non-canonical NTP hydrolase)
MEFEKLQNQVVENAYEYGKKYNVEIDQDFALFKFYEEVGELAQAVLIHRKKCRPEKYLPEERSKEELAKEFADVCGTLMLSAHLLDINLEDAIIQKWHINK